jgi:hypothetical protein
MYEKLFDKCSVLYFKNKTDFDKIVKFLKGKIVISDFKEIADICSTNGIIHVLNIDDKFLNERIDCVITNRKNIDLETKLIKMENGTSIVYINDDVNDDINKIKKWCSLCHNTTGIGALGSISKYCSDDCMNKYSKFMQNFKSGVKDLDYNSIKSKQYERNILIEFEKNPNSNSNSRKKTSINKFQTSIVKDAIRLEYAIKREIYKKEMRQPSLRKTSFSGTRKKINKDYESETVSKICKGTTKKGERCTNRSLSNNNFCGILSHSMNTI